MHRLSALISPHSLGLDIWQRGADAEVEADFDAGQLTTGGEFECDALFQSRAGGNVTQGDFFVNALKDKSHRH